MVVQRGRRIASATRSLPLGRPASRRRPRNTLAARILTAILAVLTLAVGSDWIVRAIEHNHVVDRGAGVLSHPSVHCTPGFRGGRTCTQDVRLQISADGKTVTLDDVSGLFATVSSRPAQVMPVDHVYYDTTNSEVNKVVYGTTTYRVETSRHSFLLSGIVALVVGLASLGLFWYLMLGARRARSPKG